MTLDGYTAAGRAARETGREEKFVALCQRVVDMGGVGPWGVLADSMHIVCAALREQEWAMRELAENPAWQLDEEGRLP